MNTLALSTLLILSTLSSTVPAYAQIDATTETMNDLQTGAKEGGDFINWMHGFVDNSVHRFSPVPVPEWILTVTWFVGLFLGILFLAKAGKHVFVLILAVILIATLLYYFAPDLPEPALP